MKKTLLLVFIFIGFVSEAQIKRYSFKASANYPLIEDVKNSQEIATGVPTAPWYGYYPTTKVSLKQTFESHVGIDVSANIDYSLSDRFFVTTGLSVSYIRFKQKTSIESLGTNEVPIEFPVTGTSGTPFGTIYGDIRYRDIDGNVVTPDGPGLIKMSDKVGETTTLYLQAPVLAGASLLKGKLLVRAGATFSVLLNATVYRTEATIDGSSVSLKDVKENTREGYNEVLASATVQATYLVTKRIGIDLTANKYLSPIYSDTDQDNKAKYNLVALGLSYNLSK